MMSARCPWRGLRMAIHHRLKQNRNERFRPGVAFHGDNCLRVGLRPNG